MRKVILIMTLVVAATTYTPLAHAAPGCPSTADNLEAFASCLAQTPTGAVLKSQMAYRSELDEDHLKILAAMDRNSHVPPQVMPPSTPIITPFVYPAFYPVYPVKGGRIWLYTSGGANPYMSNYFIFGY